MGSANGKLVPTGGGDAIELPGETVLIGRRPSCDIRMDFQNISGHHCRLSFRDGFWFLEDLESQNGTKVGGTRIFPRTSKMIQPGDLITIGKRDFVMDYVPGKAISPVVESAGVEDLTIPLMQKAGLEKAAKGKSKSSQSPVAFDPADFLLDDELD